MALTQLNHLTTANKNTASAASEATASVAKTANRPIVIGLMLRSQDSLTVASETLQVTSGAGTWHLVTGSARAYGSVTQCMAAVLISADTAGGVLTVSFASGRLTNRQSWEVCELQDSDVNAFVQAVSVESTTSGSQVGPTLAAFGAGVVTLAMAFADGNSPTLTEKSTYTNLQNNSPGANTSLCAEYKVAQDTTPTIQSSTGDHMYIVGLEVQAAGSSFTPKNRKTLSGLGTKVGSRQVRG